MLFLADSYGSLGRARNVGIDRARAPYIIFVEPEDYIDDDMLVYFYDAMEDEPELDLIACGVDSFGDGSYGETNKDKKRRIGEANRTQDNKMQMDGRVFRSHMYMRQIIALKAAFPSLSRMLNMPLSYMNNYGKWE